MHDTLTQCCHDSVDGEDKTHRYDWRRADAQIRLTKLLFISESERASERERKKERALKTHQFFVQDMELQLVPVLHLLVHSCVPTEASEPVL